MTKKEYIEKYGEEAYQRRLEWNRKYCKQHKEEINEQHKQYREQHREERNQLCKEYREQHREEINQYQKEYREQHRGEYKQHKKQWNRKHISMFAYCIPEQIEQIENYKLAKADNFDGWHIHHRLETHNSDGEKRLVNLSRTELKALDMYYNRPANELVFLTASEHIKLHKINRISKANTLGGQHCGKEI